MEIVVYILAVIGLACVVKHIRIMHCKEGCCLCDWLKTKVEEEKKLVQGMVLILSSIKSNILNLRLFF